MITTRFIKVLFYSRKGRVIDSWGGKRKRERVRKKGAEKQTGKDYEGTDNLLSDAFYIE